MYLYCLVLPYVSKYIYHATPIIFWLAYSIHAYVLLRLSTCSLHNVQCWYYRNQYIIVTIILLLYLRLRWSCAVLAIVCSKGYCAYTWFVYCEWRMWDIQKYVWGITYGVSHLMYYIYEYIMWYNTPYITNTLCTPYVTSHIRYHSLTGIVIQGDGRHIIT